MDDRAELFLKKYKELESVVKTVFPGCRSDERSPILYLSHLPEYRSRRAELDLCREVRNLLTHNPMIDGRYAVVPDGMLLSFLDRTIKELTDPPRAIDSAVVRERILCRTENDPVMPALRKMRENFYSQIPILRGGAVVGVFSEDTVISCLLDGAAPFGDELIFSDISGYLALDASPTVSYRFVSPETPLSDVARIFDESTDKGERVGMVFLTEKGEESGRLLGILTAWDVVSDK